MSTTLRTLKDVNEFFDGWQTKRLLSDALSEVHFLWIMMDETIVGWFYHPNVEALANAARSAIVDIPNVMVKVVKYTAEVE